MNYVILMIILGLMYYLINLQNKAILFLVLLIGGYIYYESLVPDTFWTIPKPRKKKTFEFGKLDRLINAYNSSSIEESDKLKEKIQKEINTIYFSFPNYLHSDVNKYLQQHYNFN